MARTENETLAAPREIDLLVKRADRIVETFGGFLRAGESLLSVGDADGYVSRQIQRTHGVRVRGLDVVTDWPNRRPEVPLDSYDGRHMPYASGSFDCVSAVFVLHHCDDVEGVLGEMVRVARKRILICEDIYRTWLGHKVVCAMDYLENRWITKDPNIPFNFRTVASWHETFERFGLQILESRPFKIVRPFPVTHQVFCLAKPD